MRSYAHVVVIGQHEKFIHVAAPEVTLMIRSRARICEGDFGNLQRDDDLCFVVRPNMVSENRDTIFRERAEACVGIRLDYDAENCNCETFANAVHGEWGPGLQVRETITCKIFPFPHFPISGTSRGNSARDQRYHQDGKIDKEERSTWTTCRPDVAKDKRQRFDFTFRAGTTSPHMKC